MMVLQYESSGMAKACATDKQMRKRWGEPMAARLRLRLTQLEAFVTLADASTLPAMRCHELTADRKGQIAIDLVHPHRLILRPDHDPLPTKPDGGLDRTLVTKLVVVEVVDYH